MRARFASEEALGHGAGYQYPHDVPGGILPQDYLGVERSYYEPTDRGAEAGFKRFLDAVRASRAGSPAGEPKAGSAPPPPEQAP